MYFYMNLCMHACMHAYNVLLQSFASEITAFEDKTVWFDIH